jgi:hypothetical protein
MHANNLRGDTMRFVIGLSIWFASVIPSLAACNLDRVVGYTLIAKKTIVAFVQDDKREDSFSGCQFGRILVFDDNTGVRCTDYNYTYAYRPEAFLFANSSDMKMCVEGEWFEVARLR